MLYKIIRNCCPHGNCDKCCAASNNPLPYGESHRIVHIKGLSLIEAKEIAFNWKDYKPEVVEEPDKCVGCGQESACLERELCPRCRE